MADCLRAVLLHRAGHGAECGVPVEGADGDPAVCHHEALVAAQEREGCAERCCPCEHAADFSRLA